MHNGKTFLGIIPARGGSKRLSGKHCKQLAGKPLIAWVIDAALKCNYFDDLNVKAQKPIGLLGS
jgi:CMP-N-acetylneuraminic acid synthetase